MRPRRTIDNIIMRREKKITKSVRHIFFNNLRISATGFYI